MARSQKKQVKKAEWKGYHKINLTPEHELLFEAWKGKMDIQLTDFEPLCNNGYKISFQWDDYNQGVSASLYCTAAKMEWAGYTLSAWAGDLETAIKLLFYKHFVMANETWEITKDVSNRGTSSYG